MSEPLKMDRREALKLMATAAAVPTLAFSGVAQSSQPTVTLPPPLAPCHPAGTLTDPDLIHPVIPWKKVMSQEELRTAAALCDVIIPEDDRSPSASKLKVPDFINEWISAPFSGQKHDKEIVRGGLSWINTEAHTRFGHHFADLTEDQKHQICDDICYLPKAKAEHHVGAIFFAKFRDLTASGFYTTHEGMRDVGYVGNFPLGSYPGAPASVLKKMGIEEYVKQQTS